MRCSIFAIALVSMAGSAAAQTFDFPLPEAMQRPQPRAASVQAMALSSPAWKDGGVIPVKHTQPGHDVSPALAWSNVPDGTQSFVLVAHNLDSLTAAGKSKFLYWMLWNIPGAATSLPEAIPEGSQLADGTRQISGSGPYYRGPAEPVSGPSQHYAFEIYALNAMLDVPPLGQSPALTEDAVTAAMAGKIIGKASLVGTFRRNP